MITKKQEKLARFVGYEIWRHNPKISAARLRLELRARGFKAKYPIIHTWLYRWNNGSKPKGYSELTKEQVEKLTRVVVRKYLRLLRHSREKDVIPSITRTTKLTTLRELGY